MDRRKALETIGLITAGPVLFLETFKTESEQSLLVDEKNMEEVFVKQSYAVGRQKWELERLKKLQDEPDFFTDHEMSTITALGDIIIPKDEKSGSASDAGVPEFIAFIVKDMPEH